MEILMIFISNRCAVNRNFGMDKVAGAQKWNFRACPGNERPQSN